MGTTITTGAGPAGAVSGRGVLLAQEALLLWPRGEAQLGDQPAVDDLWPVFAIVVDDHDLRRAPNGAALLGRLDGRASVTLLDGTCRWFVLAAQSPLLGLAVQATSPVPLELGFVLPARSLRAELDRLAAGPTVGITTRSRARTLAGGADLRYALRVMALTRSDPSDELAALAAPGTPT